MRRLLTSLLFYHATLTNRRKYGTIGFNIIYDFSKADLTSCAITIQRILQQRTAANSLETIEYLIGEVLYGGKAVDDKDRRLLNAITATFFSARTQEGDELSLPGNFTPPTSSIEELREYVLTLPLQD